MGTGPSRARPSASTDSLISMAISIVSIVLTFSWYTEDFAQSLPPPWLAAEESYLAWAMGWCVVLLKRLFATIFDMLVCFRFYPWTPAGFSYLRLALCTLVFVLILFRRRIRQGLLYYIRHDDE